MSLAYCYTHDRSFDTDYVEACPACVPARCDYPGCHEPRAACCDPCDTSFCEDHGSRGVNVRSVCTDANVCWKCGGYNADESFL